MNILLTGGAGYIGSHTLVQLDKAGHSVVVVDNFMNSQPEAIRRVEKIIGKEDLKLGYHTKKTNLVESMMRIYLVEDSLKMVLL